MIMITAFDVRGLCDALSGVYLRDENTVVSGLLKDLSLTNDDRVLIRDHAISLITAVRASSGTCGFENEMMERYPLWTREGVQMMCLAESFLRIPDNATRRALLQDKIKDGNFLDDFGRKIPLWMRGLSGGLYVFSKLVGGLDTSLLSRASLTIAAPIVARVMKKLATHFVCAADIEGALINGAEMASKGYAHSFDMLGEGALTMGDADRYLAAYRHGIAAVGVFNRTQTDSKNHHTISIKLSAIYPRYEPSQENRVMLELGARLKTLVLYARSETVPLTIDAEESNRLVLSLKLIDFLLQDPNIAAWGGLGVAVQAYQKRASHVIDGLSAMAAHYQGRLCVRLVKGAYWDSEIKMAQENGLVGYPVFTRKESTDLSYLVCAEKLFLASKNLYPQFATHNAMTLCAIAHMGAGRDYECQKLHSMGDSVYDMALKKGIISQCRIYAPVGPHRDLLPYLVRRLLENGANTSFIHSMADDSISPTDVCADPMEHLENIFNESNGHYSHPGIPLPLHIYGDERAGAFRLNLDNDPDWTQVQRAVDGFKAHNAYPWILGKKGETGAPQSLYAPHDTQKKIGSVWETTPDAAKIAFDDLHDYSPEWRGVEAAKRAKILNKTADLMERDLTSLMALLMHEGGKTAHDALNEVREAIDFCRYYAVMGVQLFQNPQTLPGPTGETNQLFLMGRGVFLCISPWNFPLAIFISQIAGALMAGNTVLAKPARQTPLIAHKAVQLLIEAGLPKRAMAFVPGDGAALIGPLLMDHRLGGVCFTGSTETAWSIQKNLGHRRGAIIPFIAETGGQNAMVVDSSALPEQVVRDVITSAFHSAGQRCSALRLLCIQDDIAPGILTMLTGAMDQLKIGSPLLRDTDIGPVIDAHAAANLRRYRDDFIAKGTLISEMTVPESVGNQGSFVAPSIFELKQVSDLKIEAFGPILHVVRFKESDFLSILRDINDLGYGLTFGLHSRIDTRIETVQKTVRAGNIYVGRSMTGAVVGVQPFGGGGLSGTGPKAGGPHYLGRFAVEQTVTVNTAAQGVNTNLMMMR